MENCLLFFGIFANSRVCLCFVCLKILKAVLHIVMGIYFFNMFLAVFKLLPLFFFKKMLTILIHLFSFQ
ncbi:unnamed protein product [Meloidogyne enterolobii]|uniref:Uncharacterized protein n=1 Tax=Meloidogyne enterolobii TaxID=390850 RepID=A0ACB0ZA23_MELEN